VSGKSGSPRIRPRPCAGEAASGKCVGVGAGRHLGGRRRPRGPITPAAANTCLGGGTGPRLLDTARPAQGRPPPYPARGSCQPLGLGNTVANPRFNGCACLVSGAVLHLTSHYTQTPSWALTGRASADSGRGAQWTTWVRRVGARLCAGPPGPSSAPGSVPGSVRPPWLVPAPGRPRQPRGRAHDGGLDRRTADFARAHARPRGAWCRGCRASQGPPAGRRPPAPAHLKGRTEETARVGAARPLARARGRQAESRAGSRRTPPHPAPSGRSSAGGLSCAADGRRGGGPGTHPRPLGRGRQAHGGAAPTTRAAMTAGGGWLATRKTPRQRPGSTRRHLCVTSGYALACP
jgi:hypothetical protein